MRVFSCPECSKTFVEENSVSFHLRVYAGKKHFSCPLCVRSFAQLKRLKTHLRIHTGELSDLKTHLEVHSAMKPYNSSKKPYSCEKPCAKSDSLKTHLRDHTGEKPYSGTNCTKPYAYSSALQNPFSCPSCTESFFSS
ncbi:MAG: C2H2-type zinc finger protein, partial [bacterium]